MATPTATRHAVDQGFGRSSRRYQTPDGDFDSVTSIISALSKPALISWAANTERAACLEAAAALWESGEAHAQPTRTAYLATLMERLGKQKAHQRELAKAADIGSQAHALVEWHLRKATGRPVGPAPSVSDPALWAHMAFEDWAKQVQLRPRGVEQTVWSRTHRYAGTLDCHADVLVPEHGAIQVVADWKTGKAIYGEARLQSAAYVHALVEMGLAVPPVWGCIVRFPKVETDPAFEVVLIPPAEQDVLFRAFLAVKAVWEWTQTERAAREAGQ
jgi:hypothetical protein